MKRSSFDRIHTHLVTRGAQTAVPESSKDDLEVLLRRYEGASALGFTVELSPYLETLLRVSGVTSPALAAGATVAV